MPLPRDFNTCVNSVNPDAEAFCRDYFAAGTRRFVFGRNEYSKAIAKIVEVEGFIDDYTDDDVYLNKPVLRSEQVPQEAMVVSVVIGRPFTAEKRLALFSFRSLDYFSFSRFAKDRGAAAVKFWDEFRDDFDRNRRAYDWVYDLLHDDESRSTFERILRFRLSQDLAHMRGFTDQQHRQYFEDFLMLEPEAEAFVDVGSFDGYTSEYFIKLCPQYAAVHVFEPEPKNMTVVQRRLAGHERIIYYQHGLSNRAQTLRFDAMGSCSRISDEGDLEIRVERLDDVLDQPITFFKMDIEGAEVPAIEGASQTILRNHPRIAVSVYHLFDDLWRIPKLVLSIRDDYQVYLRHYTEGVDETVMFFIPRKGIGG